MSGVPMLVTVSDCIEGLRSIRRSANISAARAEAAAEVLLREAGPWDSMGHLRHMPSHTFQRTGRYHDAVAANVRAFEADLADTQACRSPYNPGMHPGLTEPLVLSHACAAYSCERGVKSALVQSEQLL